MGADTRPPGLPVQRTGHGGLVRSADGSRRMCCSAQGGAVTSPSSASSAARRSWSWIPAVFPGEGAGLPWDDRLNPQPAYAALREALR